MMENERMKGWREGEKVLNDGKRRGRVRMKWWNGEN